MKFKILSIILFFILLIGLALIFILYQNNLKLKSEIAKQIKLSTTTQKRDSLFTARNKKYSEVITKYVDGTSFIISGKKIKSTEMAKLYDDLNMANFKLKDSLNNCIEHSKRVIDYANKVNKMLDSAYLYKSLYEYSKGIYTFNTSAERDSSRKKIIFTRTFSKADSAAILYKYFKDRMKETSPGVYTIDTSGGNLSIDMKGDKSKSKKKTKS